MVRTNRKLVLPALGLALLLVALPAAAEVYHVNLHNGASYESRYPPEEASWDADTVLVITETGTWVGIERSTIASVETETELRGYGERIDATTVRMGRTPWSGPLTEEEVSPQDRQLQLLEAIYRQQSQPPPDYTMEQFVEPGELGTGNTGGIPVGFTQQVTPPLGVAPENPR